MGKLNDIFEIWKKKLVEIEEVISEHQRQMLEKEKEEESRINQYAISSQNSQEELKNSQKEEKKAEDINSQNSQNSHKSDRDDEEEKFPDVKTPFGGRFYNPREELSYEEIEIQRQEDEIEDLLDDKQSQEIIPNHMERDHRGRKIPQFTERFRKKNMYIMIMADFFKYLEKGKRYDICLIVMSQLLLSEKLEDRRGYWWLRFTTNLKHLKWKQEAFDA
jgi:hypothetical protein